MKIVPPGLLQAIHMKTVIPQGDGKDAFIIRIIEESIERTLTTFKTLDDGGVFTAEDRQKLLNGLMHCDPVFAEEAGHEIMTMLELTLVPTTTAPTRC
ncbi:MAG: hypothetical protein H0W76_08040 [Pyrinomonadaceae bacterium]|nr:hypothetical protein [Pyrinomonadaceae bacterium]